MVLKLKAVEVKIHYRKSPKTRRKRGIKLAQFYTAEKLMLSLF